MNMKKIISTILCCACAVSMLSLAGCQTTEKTENQESAVSVAEEVESAETASLAAEETPESVSEEAVAEHYPVTITTYNYAKEPVEITFEKAPEKVITYSLNSVENMIALGLEDKIAVAMSVSRDEVLPKYQEGFDKIQAVQDQMLSKEDAIALQPDFILAWKSTFSDKNLGDVSFWHERGCNTYMALNSGLGVQSLENEYEDILNLGKIFDVEERAEALVDEMKAKVAKGQEYVKDREPVYVAIVEDEGDVFRVYDGVTVGGDIARQVGAKLFTTEEKARKSAEDLIVANPEMIFSVHFGENSTSLNDKTCLDVFHNNPAFMNIDAMKNENLYPIDLSLVYAPGVRVLESLDFFLEHLYPDMD